MRFCTQFGPLHLKRWLMRSDAEAFLQKNDARVDEVSLARSGGSWTTLLRERTGRQSAAGLLMETDYHGIEPQLLLAVDRVMVGVGGHICAVRPSDWQAEWTHQLNSPFYAFLCLASVDTFVVVHELGVEKLDGHGRVLWSYASMEIVSEWDSDEVTLDIGLYDGSRTILDLATGGAAE